MSADNSQNQIEALIFASERSISAEEIKQVIDELGEQDTPLQEIELSIASIQKKYSEANLAMELVNLNGGYQFLTRKEYYPIINQLHIHRSKKKLSQAALETLAIIAYKQPVTKLEIEQIRGVNCDYTVQKLLEKELITITGKSDSVGKPLLYGVSTLFMDYFGINSFTELPLLKDLVTASNEIGQEVLS
ncbi:MAG TPA: SMC-Scp complex subunit ScpB [Daejeonella sp.]|nr:SMC-Scp complex subunit ScpB [Daejeonella sp.]